MFKLKGNDYTQEEIKQWYTEEEEWHNQFSDGRNESGDYWIIYEVFNRKYAVDRFAELTKEKKVLSFGCAEGSDTAKLYGEYGFRLYGIESSEELIRAFRKNFPGSKIEKATTEGRINYPEDFFDYIFCFGVLHHIPNVSFVLKEFHRVLKPGGIAIIREPVCWMYSGNVKPDELSPNERGIPVSFFRTEFENLGFDILEIHKSYYKPLMFLLRKSKFLCRFPELMYHTDRLLCSLPDTGKYYPENFPDRFAASSAYYTVRKK
ncbi:MAG: class I SAM-dependent methyltransferase [Ignavibacteria bacterium]|nr:class I SAM-dependent methyltransferase [Ignavibacteria bacterium]